MFHAAVGCGGSLTGRDTARLDKLVKKEKKKAGSVPQRSVDPLETWSSWTIPTTPFNTP